MLNLGSWVAPGGEIINVMNCSSDNGFGKTEPCIRSEGMTPLGVPLDTGSCVAEASRSSVHPTGMGLVCVSSPVSLALHESLLLDVNLQLALRTIRSLVSVLTRNRPWVIGEVQLAPKSFALPSYGSCLCLSTIFSAN